MKISRIKRFARSELGAKDVEYVGIYDGYEVCSPVFDEVADIGLPQFILVDGRTAYVTVGNEGLRILDHFIKQGILD